MKHIVRGILSIFLVLTFCQTSVAGDIREPLSATGGVRNDYDSPTSSIAIILNFGKMMRGSLNKEDRARHTGAVIYALENAEDGQVVEWYNSNEETLGKIKPIMTWSVQGGICRKLITLVQKEGIAREYEEVGCHTIDSQFWSFSRR